MQVLCGQCGRTSQVDDNIAAKAVACPHCGRQISLARRQSRQAPPEATEQPQDLDEGFASQVQREISRKIVITCGACGKNLKASRRMMGRKVRCRACGRKIRVPIPDELVPDGVSPRAVSGGPQPAEPDDATELEELPTAKLVRQGLPIWIWVVGAAVLGAIVGAIIWSLAA